MGWTRHRAKQGAARDADYHSVEILAVPDGEAENDLDLVTRRTAPGQLDTLGTKEAESEKQFPVLSWD